MSDVSTTAWAIFIVSIFALLAIDLGVFNRKAHVIRPREALLQVAFFVGAAVVFNGAIYMFMGPQMGLEFTTGYIMEAMLSVDNLFVFVLVFASFCVPSKDQHKVLFYGILGALGFRMVFILAGVALVETFDWVLYIFGVFLIFTGIKMVLGRGEEKVHPDQNIMVRLFRKFMRITKDYEGDKFFVKKPNPSGKLVLWGTPMFVALIVVETTDIMFAVDSIPAILGITTNTFIVFSSNAFAILGLRSMYFALAHIMSAFCYLKYGLAGILSFVGIKMLLPIVDPELHIPVEVSLAVIIAILGVTIVASLVRNRRGKTCAPKDMVGSRLPVAEGGATCPGLKELEDEKKL